MKTVVFGSAGQLGRDLCPLLPGVVAPLTRADADLRDETALRQCLEAQRPNVVVNCAAYNFVDRAETEPHEAFAVNAWGVKNLAYICASLDATLVHFSTDYVFGFDESRREAWTEAEAPGPVSAYGLSKLTGEYWARLLCPRHLVIRTCGLYGIWGSGGKGGNFVETLLRLAGQGKPLRVVNDQRCTPSFTADVAAATASLISSGVCGLYHLTNTGDCTWYEFAREIFRQAGLAVDLTPITSAEYAAPARRPAYSVLSCQLAGLRIAQPRPWHEALAEYFSRRPIR